MKNGISQQCDSLLLSLESSECKKSFQSSSREGQLTTERSIRSLARLVECSLTGADVIFSDNFFDLPAQEAIIVTALLPVGWDLAKAQAAFRVRSVYDTYSK